MFQPQKINYDANIKFILLRCQQKKFGAVNNKGQLYLWGQDMSGYLSKEPHDNVLDIIDTPTQLNLPQVKVIDFSIQINYLCLIVTDPESSLLIRGENKYWNDRMKMVKNKWLGRRAKTDANQSSFEGLKDLSAPKMMKRSKDMPLKTIIDLKKTKDRYFFNALNEEQLIRGILQPLGSKMRSLNTQRIPQPIISRNVLRSNTLAKSVTQRNLTHKAISLNFNQSKKKQQKPVPKIQNNSQDLETGLNNNQDLIQQSNDNNNNHIQDIEEFKKEADSSVIRQQLNFNSKIYISRQKLKFGETKTSIIRSLDSKRRYLSQTFEEQYALKRIRVLNRRKQLQDDTLRRRIQKAQENTILFRETKQKLIEQDKTRIQQTQMIRGTIQSYLIKNFIIQLMQSPLVECRQAMIDNFARSLMLRRVQRNIKKMFMRNRIKFRIKALQVIEPKRFFMLVCFLRRYIKKHRNKKNARMRNIVIRQLMMGTLNEKMRIGLALARINAKKLNKFCQWIKMSREARIWCLQGCWNSHLLSIMKLNTYEAQYFPFQIPKPNQNFTFENLYEQKIRRNPNLKLVNFLDNCSIFKIKYYNTQKLSSIFHANKSAPQTPLRSSYRQRRTKIKFLPDSFNQGRQNESQEILPYSLHTNCFIKMKSNEIHVPHNLINSDAWIQIQRRTLRQRLVQCLREFQAVFKKRWLDYCQAMAHFIKDNYEILSQRRWKHIIESGKDGRTRNKIKKQRELRWIMASAGYLELFLKDVLNEKQAMLEEAQRMKNCPRPPEHKFQLTHNEFNKLFKVYFTTLQLRAKSGKRLATSHT